MSCRKATTLSAGLPEGPERRCLMGSCTALACLERQPALHCTSRLIQDPVSLRRGHKQLLEVPSNRLAMCLSVASVVAKSSAVISAEHWFAQGICFCSS
ncbi:hypothetical protein [Spartinivicinus marinus]|uniref:hypothetical protein n=1 Tax=Spartinivicinus marinus TaxID=2994442 RepID=UPI002258F401|nr:hypothetical protein [Spartinivicinus marinus]MCX4026581.1 hypothetical protein [Spartinivicinus marinus]